MRKEKKEKSLEKARAETRSTRPVLIVALAGIILSLLLAPQILAIELISAGHMIVMQTSDEQISVGAPVQIEILSAASSNEVLTISSNTKLYKYSGALNETIAFIPEAEGMYKISLTDKTNGQVIDVLEFKTGNIIAQPEVVPRQPEEGSESQRVLILRTDKQQYVLGETVIAQVAAPPEKLQEYRVYYEYSGLSQKYLGDLSLISFIPKGIGTHSLILRDANDNEIERVSFDVIEKKEPNNANTSGNTSTEGISNTAGYASPDEQYPPFENQTEEEKHLGSIFRIKDSEGATRNAEVRIRQRKASNEDKSQALPEPQALDNNSKGGARTGEEYLDVEVNILGRSVKRIRLNGLKVNFAQQFELGVDDISPEKLGMGEKTVQKAYGIDPTNLTFTNGTITSIAKGRELWKCKDWSFQTQTCMGAWEKILDLIPGLEYSVALTPDDPGFAETGLSTINTEKSVYKPGEEARIFAVVLDRYGYLVKGANVTITITRPDNATTTFSTDIDSVTESANGVYEARYNYTELEGNYTMSVSAYLSQDPTYVNSTMLSYFTVLSQYDFDIIRRMPITIDPWKGPFKATLEVNPLNENITIYNVTEMVPSEVEIVEASGAAVTTVGNTTMLKWIDLTDSSMLNYSARAPLISPNLLVFGRAVIEYVIGGTLKIFQEFRNWYVAVDPTPTQNEGLAVYADAPPTGNVGFPKFRNWTGTTIQQEQSSGLNYGSTISWQKFRCLKKYPQCILVNSDDDTGAANNDDINFAVFYTDTSLRVWANSTQLATSTDDITQNFDVECEDLSGECLVAYENDTGANAAFMYRIWNGTNLSAETSVSVTGANNLEFDWVALYPQKDANRIGIVLQNNAGGTGGTPDIYAGMWNDTGFINWTTINLAASSSGDTHTYLRDFDCAWDALGQFWCAFGTNGQASINWTIYNSTSTVWRSNGSFYGASGTEIAQVGVCGLEPWHNYNHSYIGVIFCDSGNDVDGGMWNGTNFSKSATNQIPYVNNNGECYSNKAISSLDQNLNCKWEYTGDQAIFVWADNGEDWTSMLTYTKSTAAWSSDNWSLGTQVVTDGANDLRNNLLVSNPASDYIMMAYGNLANDGGCTLWKGDSWDGTGCNNSFAYETAGPKSDTLWNVFDWFRVPPPQPWITIIEPNGTSVEADYYGITSPSSTSKAYNGSSTALPPGAAAAPVLGTEATSNGYVNLSQSDNLRTRSVYAAAGGYRAYQSFNLSITQSIVSMTKITITHEGYATTGTAQTADNFNIYAYNWATDTYDLLRTVLTSPVDVRTDIEITSSISNYIRYKQILLLVEASTATTVGAGARSEVLTDYIVVTVENIPLISQTIRVNASALDDDGVSFCEWALFNTTASQITNLTRMNLTGGTYWFNRSDISTIPDGYYNVTVFCNDTTTSRTNATESIYIDNTPPAIELYTPSNASNLTTNYALFAWNVTDVAFENLLCNVTLDSTVRGTNVLSVHGENTTTNITSITDGAHYWNVSCTDNAGNRNTSITWMFDTDTAGPVVTPLFPASGVYINNNPLDINFSATDSHQIVNCSLRLDGLINSTLFNITSGAVNNFTFAGLNQTTHYWNVTCFDSFGFNATSANRNFTYDITSPGVVLNTTAGALFNGTIPQLNYTATDNMDVNLTCNITVNDVIVDANINSPNNSMRVRNVSLTDGYKSWNVTCWDDAGNVNTSETRIFRVIGGPVVILISPANKSVSDGYNVTLRYNASDGNGVVNCTLYFDGAYNQTNSTISNFGTNNTFQLDNVSEGAHTWNITCLDGENMTGWSETNTLYSDRTPPTITLNYPPSGQNIQVTPMQTNFTMTDAISPNATCNITIDGNVSAGNLNINAVNNTLVTKSNSLANGIHWWNVTCIDRGGNANISENRNFTMNVTVPIAVTVIADKVSYQEGEIAIVNVTTRNDTNGLTATNITLDYIYTNRTYTDVPWWNNSWQRRKPIYLNETQGLARTDKPIAMNISFPYGTLSSCANELRIISDLDLTERAFTYISGDDVTYCYILFNGSVSASAVNENNYHVYFNNSAATNPGYSSYTNITHTTVLYDNFADGNLDGWTAGGGWDTSTGDPMAGTHAHVDGTVTNTAVYPTNPFNLAGFDQVNLTFQWQLDGTWDAGPPADFISLDFTNSSGSTWDANVSTKTSTNQGLATFSYLFNSTYQVNGFNFRFRATTNDATEDGGFDNVNLTGINSIQANITAGTGDVQIWFSREVNVTNATGMYVSRFNTLSVSGIYGNYSAVALAKGNSLKTRDGWGYDWYNVIADTFGPVITIIYPPNMTTARSGNITFNYTAVDFANNVSNCSLYINGALNQTNYTINESANQTFLVQSMVQGVYSWYIQCFDNLVSNTTSGNYTLYLDDSAPSIYLISPDGTTHPTGSIQFRLNATDNMDTSIYCNVSVDNGNFSSTLNVTNATIGSVNISINYTGIHYWNATCYDNINNSAQSTTFNFTTADLPIVKLHSPADGYAVNATSIVLQYNLSSAEVVNCTLILNGAYNETQNATDIPYKANNGQNNFTLTGMSYERYNWTVICFDSNGFNGTDTIRKFYLDDAAPNITLNAPQNGGNLYTLTVRYNFTTIDVDDILVCNLTDNGTIVFSNFNATTGGQTLLNRTSTPIGLHYWNVTCFDNAGFSSTSETWNYTIISNISVTLVSPANSSFDGDGNITFTYKPQSTIGFDLGYCDLYIDGVYNNTQVAPVNDANNNLGVSNVAEGWHSWYMNCTDSVKTAISTTWNFTVDKTAPNTTAYAPNGTTLGDNSVGFNWTSADNYASNLTCTVRVNGTAQSPTVIMQNGTIANQTYSGFSDGLYFWNVTCMDQAGNNGTSQKLNFTIFAPPTIVLNYPANNNRTSIGNITFRFTPSDNSGFINNCTIILDGIANQTNTTQTVSGVERNITVYGIAEGPHNWSVNCTDLTGNVGSSAEARNFSVDTSPPNITTYYPSEGDFLNTNNVKFNWSAEDYNGTQISCQLFIDFAYNQTITLVSGSIFNVTVNNMTEGPHNWSVNCSDNVGNYNQSGWVNFIINSPDLYIDNIRFTINSTNPDLNDQVQLRANVTNLGGIPALNAVVDFWDGTPGIGTYLGNDTRNVSVGANVTFTLNWNITQGYHTIWSVVDPNNLITELNESNNNASLNISVLWINLTAPANNSIYNMTNISINFTMRDYTLGAINYTIFVNGVANQTNTSQDNVENYANLSLNEGRHRINVQATDQLGRKKNSTSIFVVIDYTAPYGNVTTPNGTWYNYSAPQVNITSNDNTDLNINFTLFVNGTADVIGNITNGTTLAVNITTRPDGLYELVLQMTDDANNTRNSTPSYIYIDTTKPSIALNAPPNAETVYTRNLTLNFTANDNLAITLTCNVTLDGTIIGGRSVNNGVPATYNLSNLTEGTHYWNISCRDQAQNYNISETRSFNIFNPPQVALHAPPNNTVSNNQTQVLYFNVSDETGIQNCTLILNGALNETKTNSQLTNNATNNFTLTSLNGTYTWAVTCYDNSTLFIQNTSQTWVFTVDIDPPNSTILTANQTWFNTSNPQIRINITDNFDTLLNYTVFVNGLANATGTISNGTLGLPNLTGLSPNGNFTVILQGRDDAGNAANSTAITIYIDTLLPWIDIIAPPNGASFNITTMDFNFTPYDYMASFLICNLTISNGFNELNMNITNGTNTLVSKSNFVSGTYYWNVTCYDLAGNTNTSQTRNFTINSPDLIITSSNISFNDTVYEEGLNITIYANVFNIGGVPAYNISVRFWRGDPALGGTQIATVNITQLNSLANETVNITYAPVIGLNNMFVEVDPPTATNGTIAEENESNNKANKSFEVALYQIFAGNLSGIIELEKQSVNRSLFNWNLTNANMSYLFIADIEGNINFFRLQAIGMNNSNESAANDFANIDTRLGTTNLTDSINKTYTANNNPKLTANLTLFGRGVLNVPVINSTNTSNFITGLLWDSADGGIEYNGTQDILLVSNIAPGALGSRGNYDFEVSVPAYLRNYNAAGSSVAFYVELV